MADIITRLLLKTNDFDTNLNKAKGSVNSFQGGVSNMAATAGAGVMKFAGAIGMAVGAGEALMKTIRSSQATNDAFDNNMNACKDSVDAFFSSLATGDFSAFEGGLLSLFDKAKDLSSALDDIADKRLSIDLVDLRKQGEMTALEAIIRDTSKTKKDRSEALSKYQSLAKEVAANRMDIAREELVGNTNVELNKIGVKNLSQDDVTLYLEKLNNKDLNQQFLKELKYVSDYKKLYDEEWAKVVSYRKRNGADEKSFQMEREFSSQFETPDKRMKRAFPKSEFRDSKQLFDFGKLFQQGDNGRTALYEYTTKLYMAENQNAADIRKLTKLKNSTNASSGGSDSAGKKEDAPLSGSLAWFDSELSKKNKELSTATTMQARAAVQTTINELEQQKINLKIVVDKETFKIKHGEMKDSSLSGPVRPSGAIEKFDTSGIKLPPFINEKDLEANEEFAQSLTGIAAGFSVLGQAAGQFGEDGLSFALNSIGAIAQMITSLEALATAQGVASAFSLPFPASLGAIATVIGTITSIFSSLPAFANGGIVPGGSFTGDKVHALVNSGEMILNGGQQSNLFRLLNGGIPSAERVNIGPQIRRIAALIAPTADSRRIEVSGNVRVRGRDLDLALRNNDKITSKIR